MKTAVRDFRDNIVHVDVIADYVHRQTTSGSTRSHNATVLQNMASISAYQHYLKSTVTEEHLTDADFPRDRNRNWKTNSVATYKSDNNNVINQLPEICKADMTSSNESADRNNNNSVYNYSTSVDCAQDHVIRRKTVSGETVLVRNRVPHRRTKAATTQTMKQSASRKIMFRQVASCVRHKTEVVCTVTSPRDDEVPTTESDQSNYSGIYERDLEEILESVANIGRYRRNMSACRSRQLVNIKCSFWPPRSPEVESYRSTSDSCSERSDSEGETERKWTSEDEFESESDGTAAVDSNSFLRRLNRLLVTGNCSPDMTGIEP